jgi:hypothetical protein
VPQTVTLRESAPVTIGAGGTGTAKLGPQGSGETWHPAKAHVSVSTNVLEATCKIFVGDQPVQINYRDGTLSGSTGDATGHVNADEVKLGKYVWAVWAGADVGATAYPTVTGTKDI